MENLLVFAVALEMLADGNGLIFVRAIFRLLTEEAKENGTQ